MICEPAISGSNHACVQFIKTAVILENCRVSTMKNCGRHGRILDAGLPGHRLWRVLTMHATRRLSTSCDCSRFESWRLGRLPEQSDRPGMRPIVTNVHHACTHLIWTLYGLPIENYQSKMHFVTSQSDPKVIGMATPVPTRSLRMNFVSNSIRLITIHEHVLSFSILNLHRRTLEVHRFPIPHRATPNGVDTLLQ